MSNHGKHLTPDKLVRFVYRLASNYVAHPERLEVTAERKEAGHYVVTIPGAHHKADHGKLLGMQAKNLRALILLTQEYGKRYGRMVYLDLHEPPGERSNFGDSSRIDCPEDWLDTFKGIVEEVCADLFEFPVRVQVVCKGGLAFVNIHTDVAILPAVTNAMSILFGAIGRMRGLSITLNAIPTSTPEDGGKAV